MIFQAGSDGILRFGDRSTRCALGRGGVVASAAKREGDLASPAGIWSLREVFYRPDKFAGPPKTALPITPLSPELGWCDAPADPAYNQLVALPYPATAERLWRDDDVYDLIVVLGYNDDPPRPGAGSAIFWHLSRPDWRGTEGCVAVAREAMLQMLALMAPGDALEIRL